MKFLFSFFLTAVASCLLAACAGNNVTVVTDHDPAGHFGAYKTYTLAPPKNGQAMSPSGEAALRDTLRTQLAAREITEAPGKQADLDVVRHAFVQEKTSVQQYTDWGYRHHGSWPYRYGYYGMWSGAPVTYLDVNQYHEGTLVLDFVDAHTKKLVFRGVGQAVVSGSEANTGKVREAVEKMMAQFPRGS